MTSARDHMRDHIETTRYMQDRHERGQHQLAERLFETELALSNRVRIFAAAVLAVSWGLVLEPRGFDLRILLASCVLAVISLMLDFSYFLCRRIALAAAFRRGSNAYNGIGPFVGLAALAGFFRALFFFAATGALAAAAILALLPQLMALTNG